VPPPRRVGPPALASASPYRAESTPTAPVAHHHRTARLAAWHRARWQSHATKPPDRNRRPRGRPRSPARGRLSSGHKQVPPGRRAPSRGPPTLHAVCRPKQPPLAAPGGCHGRCRARLPAPPPAVRSAGRAKQFPPLPAAPRARKLRSPRPPAAPTFDWCRVPARPGPTGRIGDRRVDCPSLGTWKLPPSGGSSTSSGGTGSTAPPDFVKASINLPAVATAKHALGQLLSRHAGRALAGVAACSFRQHRIAIGEETVAVGETGRAEPNSTDAELAPPGSPDLRPESQDHIGWCGTTGARQATAAKHRE